MLKIGENIKGYQVVEEKNVGGFCTAYKAIKSGSSFFLKQYCDPKPISKDYASFFANQALMIQKLKAIGNEVENIVEHFEYKDHYYQVKDYIQGDDLGEWLSKNFNFNDRKNVALLISQIVKKIHAHNIIHQDLKPEQFMLIPDASEYGFKLILTDFDWSIPDGKLVRRVGTPWYKCIDNNVSSKSDVFVLGIIICELLTGVNLYQHNGYYEDSTWNNWVLQKKIKEPKVLNSDDITDLQNTIILRCIDIDPAKRPTIDEIIDCLTAPKLKLVSLKTGGKQILIPVGGSVTRKEFKALFYTVTDGMGNPIHRYLDPDVETLKITTNSEGALVSTGNLTNKIRLNGSDIIGAMPIRTGDKVEIYSVKQAKTIAVFDVECK